MIKYILKHKQLLVVALPFQKAGHVHSSQAVRVLAVVPSFRA